MTGKKYGRLTCLFYDNKKKEWRCECDCGNIVYSTASKLNRKHGKQSCGCHIEDRKRVSAYNIKYYHYQKSAKQRGCDFDIGLDAFIDIVSKDCVYCKKKASIWSTKYGGNIPINGIDRLDSSKGYEITNCVPCCQQCNYAKGDFEQNRWLNLISRFNEDPSTKKKEIRDRIKAWKSYAKKNWTT